MFETSKQAAAQETLIQEGSMISLSDKWRIQLEDSPWDIWEEWDCKPKSETREQITHMFNLR